MKKENERLIANMRLIDQPLFQLAFDNWKEGAQHYLRMILDDDTIEVEDVVTEYWIGQLDGKAVVLDCFIKDSRSNTYDMEA